MTEPNYPIELSRPDIGAYRAGNTGVEYLTTFDSGRAGPHIMLSALVHGNELCGAIALDFLFKQKLRPRRGKLTLAFMNVAAFASFSPQTPNASRYVEEDFNRLWASQLLDGPRDSLELRRAREVRPIVDRVDYLLDIHSMQHRSAPLMLCGPTAKGRALARKIPFPGFIVSDTGHAAGRRMRDYAAFSDPDSPKNALLVECGQHWETQSAVVAKQVALRFLAYFELLDTDAIDAQLEAETPPTARLIEVTEPVTIASEEFRFAQPFLGLEVIPKRGTLIGWDGEREVRTPYDDCVLVMPSLRLEKGQTAVRLGRFTDD